MKSFRKAVSLCMFSLGTLNPVLFPMKVNVRRLDHEYLIQLTGTVVMDTWFLMTMNNLK